eukprot:TRINITY_DN1478_c0_g1_i3.p1 TRINITY_DN1478_c0_g1~~TRINITY_DN1478_c0_g1_i3.p1  ORF type:complete len:500 (-),score=30.32 TRINITY_DN1478_c0_g1_i3:634-2133(-)
MQGVGLLAIGTSLKSLQPPPCSDHHTVCIRPSGEALAVLYTALYLVALGAGGVKSNVSGFGSDQFDVEDRKEEKQMIYFFNRFYFCISLGSLFAVTVLVYIQDYVSRAWGYGIPAGSMALSAILLLACSRIYRYRKPAGSPIVRIAQVLVASWRNRKLQTPSDLSMLNHYQDSSSMGGQRFPHTSEFRCLDKAAVVDPTSDTEPAKASPWKLSSVQQVEEVKILARLLPIWSTCIMFWTVYSQMLTFSVQQASTMDRSTGGLFEIPAASLHVFVVGGIMLVATLSEKVLVPLMRRLTGRLQGITTLQRISVGLILSMFAMLAAALVEKRRLLVVHENGLTNRRSATVPMSAYWLAPQFFLVGAGEAFAYVGQLEFFIKEAPISMKSMSTGLFLSTLSMGFFFSTVLVTFVNVVTSRGGTKGWLPETLNKGRLDYFYGLLTALSFLNLLLFFVFAKLYKYRQEISQEEIVLPKSESSEGMKEKEAERAKEEGMDVFYVEV